jgi:hypothetical protein
MARAERKEIMNALPPTPVDPPVLTELSYEHERMAEAYWEYLKRTDPVLRWMQQEYERGRAAASSSAALQATYADDSPPVTYSETERNSLMYRAILARAARTAASERRRLAGWSTK